MIKKLAAFGLTAALALSPVAVFAQAAAPETTPPPGGAPAPAPGGAPAPMAPMHHVHHHHHYHHVVHHHHMAMKKTPAPAEAPK